MNGNKSIAIICAATLFVSVRAFAQPDSLWSRTFGTSGSDECRCAQQTSDGGYILAGGIPSYGCWLLKTDANGDTLWSRTFAEACYSVQQTSDGGYVLAGFDFTWYEDWWDFWLLKTDANGNRLWSETFGGYSDDECFSVQQTTDGGYVLAGYTETFGAGSYDFWLVKTDAHGSLRWSRTFGGFAHDVCYSVQQTLDGGYVLAGFTESFGSGSSDFWLVKTDASGDSLWSRTFGGSSVDDCHCVRQTSGGGYILAGRTASFGVGSDFWLVKTNINGDSLWSRTYGGNSWEECYSVQQTSDGGYLLAGDTRSFGSGNDDFWLVKTDVDGNLLWSRAFGGSSWDRCRSAQQTSDGGYVMAGYTGSFGAGWADFWLVKTGPDLAAEPISVSMPAQYALHPNWPNPFNPVTRISYDLPRTGVASVKVFDLLGREVETLVDAMQPAGNHSIPFDGSGLASGIYFYRLQIGDFLQTRKMVLLK